MALGPGNSESKPAPAHWPDGLLLLVLAPVVIAGCLFAPPLTFDDPVHLGHELLSPKAAYVFRATDNSTYFPVTVISYRVDHWLYGVDALAPGVRVTSLLLHLLAGLFIWRTFLNLKAERWVSLFAAALWIVHPTACESVAWISERKNVLAACFGFAAVWAFCGGVRRRPLRELVTFGLYLLALLSKPSAAGFWPVFVAFEVLKPAEPPPAKVRHPALLSVLCFAAMLAATLALAKLNVAHNRQTMVAPAGGSLFTALLTDAPVLARYVENALAPVWLSIFYYVQPVASLGDARLWGSLLALGVTVGGTIWLSTRRRLTAFLWLWFFGALGPALNIIPLPFLMQDRYMYFALPALLLIAALTATALVERLKLRLSPALALSAAGVILMAMSALTVQRSRSFGDEERLYRGAVTLEPQSAYARWFLATTLSLEADLREMQSDTDADVVHNWREEALEHVNAALTAPDYDRLIDHNAVRVVQGALCERLGQDVAAKAILHDALLVDQKPYNRLLGCLSIARIMLREGRPDVALEWVLRGAKAVGSLKASPQSQLLLGECYDRMGDVKMALEAYNSVPKSSLAWRQAQERALALRASHSTPSE